MEGETAKKSRVVVSTEQGISHDTVVALYVLPFLVLAVFQIGAHTRYGEIFPAAIQRGNEIACPRNYLPVFIQCRPDGKFVMLKGQVLFSRPVLGCKLPNGRKQFIIYRENGNNRAHL